MKLQPYDVIGYSFNGEVYPVGGIDETLINKEGDSPKPIFRDALAKDKCREGNCNNEIDTFYFCDDHFKCEEASE